MKPDPVKILVVNDNASALAALEVSLAPLGETVVTAQSGGAALDLVHADDSDIALALIDIRMPDMDGFELATRLRALDRLRPLPIIFASGWDPNPDWFARMYDLGAADFLSLPIQPRALQVKVSVFADLHRKNLALKQVAVAARREADSTAQHHQERLRWFMEAVSDYAFFFTDAEGTITEWTPAARALFGYASEEAVGQPLGLIFTPTDRATGRPEVEMEEAARDGQAKDERFHCRKDGTQFFAAGRLIALRDHTGTVRGFSKIVRDATAARDKENEVKASERKFREIFETAYEGIWILNAEGRIETVNERMSEMLGYPQNEIVGRPKSELVFLEDRQRMDELLDERRRGKFASVEVRFRRKDGTALWTLLSARPFMRGGKFAGALDMFTDISARKLAAEQFEQALKAQVFERTAALRAKTAQLEGFSYSVAHDLRAPLRAVRGYAEIVLEDYGSAIPPDAMDYIRKIQSGADRMDELLQDLLTYSRVDQAEFAVSNIPLRPSVDWALEQIKAEVQARGAVIDLPEGDLPQVQAERSIVDQIVFNLVSNAVKFVPPGRTPRVVLRTQERDGLIRLTVTDNGVGVSREYHERIFRVFERVETEHRVPGTGVGLAIVARAAERLGGGAGVVSEPGAGSTFWVELKKAMP
jgi:PAS domain S-box-containing protein